MKDPAGSVTDTVPAQRPITVLDVLEFRLWTSPHPPTVFVDFWASAFGGTPGMSRGVDR